MTDKRTPDSYSTERAWARWAPTIIWAGTVLLGAGGLIASHRALAEDVVAIQAEQIAHDKKDGHATTLTTLALHEARLQALERRAAENSAQIETTTRALIKIETRLDAICDALGPRCKRAAGGK